MPEIQDDPNQSNNPNHRLCDFCGDSTAILFCRADSAKLCLSCDREVHSTNPLFTKHTRWLLCDVCDASPALIFCVSDKKVLCHNCDFETHKCLRNPLVVHDHRALEGFDGCPKSEEIAGFVGFEDFDPKAAAEGGEAREGKGKGGCGGTGMFCDGEDDVVNEYLVWDVEQQHDGVVSIDELIVATADKGHNFQALDVPPLPKDRNVACGKHKQEILRQLCQLAKKENTTILQGELLAIDQFLLGEFDYGVQDVYEVLTNVPEPVAFVGDEANSYSWCNNEYDAANEFLLSSPLLGSYVEDGASLTGNNSYEQNASVTEPSEPSQEVPAQEFSAVDRDAALSRYKEKKRTRRYDKHIRYESRKVLAEGRTRIKGRFAKVERPVTKSRRRS